MRLKITGEYPADWATIAQRVKNDAARRCVRCKHPFNAAGKPTLCDDRCDATRGMHKGSYIAVPFDERLKGINYGVHHFDGDKSNCRWWNLLALCNSCHLSIQARVIPERPWLFTHSTWAFPYICGFYAFFYGHTEITRQEADRESARWIAAGQPWLFNRRDGVAPSP